jgi:phosphatidylinositol-3-phosphatase
MQQILCLLSLAAVLLLPGCGGGASNNSGPPPSPPSGPPPPQFGRVFMVVEENKSYSQVIGNPVMPYLNSLATQYGLATNYFADTHPSIGNYFMMTTGQVITNDDEFTGTVSADNVVRRFMAAGKTWGVYAESLPSTGYTGEDVYPYLKNHNPFAYLSDVITNLSETTNLVPFSRFATDLANGSLPQYVFIVPNAENDAHDCPGGGTGCSDDVKLAAADMWLQTNIAPLITSTSFQTDELLVITFDEANLTDSSHGGGQVATVIVSPKAKKGFQSSNFYQHENLLKLSLNGLGVNSFPGAASNTSAMGDFF